MLQELVSSYYVELGYCLKKVTSMEQNEFTLSHLLILHRFYFFLSKGYTEIITFEVKLLFFIFNQTFLSDFWKINFSDT